VIQGIAAPGGSCAGQVNRLKSPMRRKYICFVIIMKE
jgi:hypothetical protein